MLFNVFLEFLFNDFFIFFSLFDRIKLFEGEDFAIFHVGAADEFVVRVHALGRDALQEAAVSH